MDNAARTRQRVLAIFLPLTAVLYISAEALSPKGIVPEAGHYPQSQRPGITTGAVLRFLESVTGRG